MKHLSVSLGVLLLMIALSLLISSPLNSQVQRNPVLEFCSGTW